MSRSQFNKNSGQKLLAIGLATILLFAVSVVGIYNIFFTTPNISKAGGVTPTITPSIQNVSTLANVSVAFPTSAALSVGNQIQFSYNNAYTGTITTANITVNTVAPSAVTLNTVGTTTTATLTLANAITSGATVTITTTGLTSPSAAANYTFSIRTPVDFGANFQYVGQANVVQVTAFIPINLSFSIRNTGDTANTNACDLGTVSTTAVSTCSYRLKVSSNAKSGYTVSYQASGGLSDGSNTMNNAAVGSAGTGGTNIVAGTETYGVRITPGSITGASGIISTSAAFNAGATNSVQYNNTTPTVILTATKPNSPTASGDTTNTSLITHNLGITSNTESGNYSQTITYTVAPSF